MICAWLRSEGGIVRAKYVYSKELTNEFRGNDDTDADADAETTDERLDAPIKLVNIDI